MHVARWETRTDWGIESVKNEMIAFCKLRLRMRLSLTVASENRICFDENVYPQRKRIWKRAVRKRFDGRLRRPLLERPNRVGGCVREMTKPLSESISIRSLKRAKPISDGHPGRSRFLLLSTTSISSLVSTFAVSRWWEAKNDAHSAKMACWSLKASMEQVYLGRFCLREK